KLPYEKGADHDDADNERHDIVRAAPDVLLHVSASWEACPYDDSLPEKRPIADPS
nr:hypothetical protein [Tanacetum cinerariifolium]